MQTVLLLLIKMKKESITFQINANGGILTSGRTHSDPSV